MVAIFRRIVSPSSCSATPVSASAFPGNFQTNAQWALAEFGSIELGDLRSNRRMVKVFGQMLDAEEISALEAYDSKGKPAAPDAAPLSIGAAVKSIARLGGHLGRKGDGHPGAQVLWQGLHQLDAITEAWRRFGARKSCG